MTSSRFVRFATLAVALVCFALPGCVKKKAKIALGKDGSGTITETDTFDLSKLDGLSEMLKGMMGGGAPEGQPGEGQAGGNDPMKDMDEDTDPEALKKKLAGKKGIELVSATRSEDAEKKTRTAEKKIKFTTLEDYFRAGLAKNIDVKLESVPGGAWKLSQTAVGPGGEAAGPEAEQMAAAFKPMLEQFLGDLEMNYSIDLPGTVTETNGTKDEAGTSVTWKMNFADVFDPKKQTMSVTFKGEGLTLKPFHIVLDDKGVASDPKAKPAPEAPKEPAPKEPEAPKDPPKEEPK